MDERKIPKVVAFDLVNLAEEEKKQLMRLGVLTDIAIDDDILRVRGGIGQEGDHDTLASKVTPGSDRFMELPPYMASRQGAVLGWCNPDHSGDFALIAGQKPGSERQHAELDDKQTDACLWLAAVALGILLKKSPRQLGRLPQDEPLMLSAPVLSDRSARKIRRRIIHGGT